MPWYIPCSLGGMQTNYGVHQMDSVCPAVFILFHEDKTHS
jgi:hypothetical protein